jgi:hypothetical protein
MAFAHSMLTALRHPACACQQRRLSGHGQPLTDDAETIQAPGGSRGTPGMNTIPRAMHSSARPTNRCPRTSVRGFLSTSVRPGGPGQHQPTVFLTPSREATRRLLQRLVLRKPGSADARRAVFTKNIASCDFFLANAVCWCCTWHPAMQAASEIPRGGRERSPRGDICRPGVLGVWTQAAVPEPARAPLSPTSDNVSYVRFRPYSFPPCFPQQNRPAPLLHAVADGCVAATSAHRPGSGD